MVTRCDWCPLNRGNFVDFALIALAILVQWSCASTPPIILRELNCSAGAATILTFGPNERVHLHNCSISVQLEPVGGASSIENVTIDVVGGIAPPVVIIGAGTREVKHLTVSVRNLQAGSIESASPVFLRIGDVSLVSNISVRVDDSVFNFTSLSQEEASIGSFLEIGSADFMADVSLTIAGSIIVQCSASIPSLVLVSAQGRGAAGVAVNVTRQSLLMITTTVESSLFRFIGTTFSEPIGSVRAIRLHVTDSVTRLRFRCIASGSCQGINQDSRMSIVFFQQIRVAIDDFAIVFKNASLIVYGEFSATGQYSYINAAIRIRATDAAPINRLTITFYGCSPRAEIQYPGGRNTPPPDGEVEEDANSPLSADAFRDGLGDGQQQHGRGVIVFGTRAANVIQFESISTLSSFHLSVIASDFFVRNEMLQLNAQTSNIIAGFLRVSANGVGNSSFVADDVRGFIESPAGVRAEDKAIIRANWGTFDLFAFAAEMSNITVRIVRTVLDLTIENGTIPVDNTGGAAFGISNGGAACSLFRVDSDGSLHGPTTIVVNRSTMIASVSFLTAYASFKMFTYNSIAIVSIEGNNTNCAIDMHRTAVLVRKFLFPSPAPGIVRGQSVTDPYVTLNSTTLYLPADLGALLRIALEPYMDMILLANLDSMLRLLARYSLPTIQQNISLIIRDCLISFAPEMLLTPPSILPPPPPSAPRSILPLSDCDTIAFAFLAREWKNSTIRILCDALCSAQPSAALFDETLLLPSEAARGVASASLIDRNGVRPAVVVCVGDCTLDHVTIIVATETLAAQYTNISSSTSPPSQQSTTVAANADRLHLLNVSYFMSSRYGTLRVRSGVHMMFDGVSSQPQDRALGLSPVLAKQSGSQTSPSTTEPIVFFEGAWAGDAAISPPTVIVINRSVFSGFRAMASPATVSNTTTSTVATTRVPTSDVNNDVGEQRRSKTEIMFGCGLFEETYSSSHLHAHQLFDDAESLFNGTQVSVFRLVPPLLAGSYRDIVFCPSMPTSLTSSLPDNAAANSKGPITATNAEVTAQTATAAGMWVSVILSQSSVGMGRAFIASSAITAVQGVFNVLLLSHYCKDSTATDGTEEEASSSSVADIALSVGSSPIDNPLLLRISMGDSTSFLDHAVGAVVGNSAMWISMGVILHGAFQLRSRIARETLSFSPVERFILSWFPQCGFPGCFLAPHALLLEPTIMAAVFLIACNISVGATVIAFVVMLLWILWLSGAVWLIARSIRPFPFMHSERKASRLRRTNSSSIISQYTEWVFTPDTHWTIRRRHANAPDGSTRRKKLKLFTDKAKALFEPYSSGHHLFFAVESVCTWITGIISGAALGAEAPCDSVVWCGWVLATLYAAQAVYALVRQPLLTRYENVSGAALLLLAASSAVAAASGNDDASTNLALVASFMSLLLALIGIAPPIFRWSNSSNVPLTNLMMSAIGPNCPSKLRASAQRADSSTNRARTLLQPSNQLVANVDPEVNLRHMVVLICQRQPVTSPEVRSFQ